MSARHRPQCSSSFCAGPVIVGDFVRIRICRTILLKLWMKARINFYMVNGYYLDTHTDRCSSHCCAAFTTRLHYWTGGQSLELMDISWPNGDIYNRTRSLLAIVFLTRCPTYLISVPMSLAFTYFRTYLPLSLVCSVNPAVRNRHTCYKWCWRSPKVIRCCVIDAAYMASY